MIRVGDVVAGKYRVERELGRGGMGAVYVATNERLQKRVALKVLRSDHAVHPEAVARLTQEAIAASRARHPGIVEIYDADTTDGVTWIAMELLAGQSLADRMKRQPISQADAVRIVREALDALSHVHRQGIIHRDLKPDNLFLELLPDGSERVKLLDFGVAASTGGELERITRTGIAVGTPLYFAPEQAAGERDLDGRVDVYAMGTLLFELLAGRLPYEAESIGAMVRKMYTEGPPDLSRLDPRISPRLANVVSLALAVDRNERIGSADAFRRALESVDASESAAQALATSPTAYAPIVSTPRTGPAAFAATAYSSATPDPASVQPATAHPATALPAAPLPAAVQPAHPAPAHPATVHPAIVGAAPAARSGGGSRFVVLLALAGIAAALVAAVGVGGAAFYFGARADDELATQPTATQPTQPTVASVPTPLAPTPVEVELPVADEAPTAPPEEAAEAPLPLPPSRRGGDRERGPLSPSRRDGDRERAPSARRGGEERAPEPAPVARSVDPPPPPAVSGEPRPIPNDVWVRVLTAHETELDGCYYAHYTSPPRPRVSTQVTMQVTVAGGVSSVSVAGAPSSLGRCLEGVLRRARFPSNPWPSRGSFQLTLFDS